MNLATTSTPIVALTDSDLGGVELEQEVLGSTANLVFVGSTDPDIIAGFAREASALIVQRARIDGALMDRLPRLELIVRYGVGLDGIDLSAAARRGILVTGVPDYCIDEVAHHTVAFIVAASRGLTAMVAAARAGSWGRTGILEPLLPADDPVGIIGAGRIGREVMVRIAALGHPVKVFDPFANGTLLPDGCEWCDDLGELAAVVNHLSLHVPLTTQTRHLISDELLDRLGPRGHLVNTARGELVDEDALLRALDEHRLGYASLDALSVEPPQRTNPLLSHTNVTVTPHVAYLSTRSLAVLRTRAAEIVRAHLLDTDLAGVGEIERSKGAD